MTAPDTLKADLKRLVIEALNIEGVRPEDIQDDAPLFGDSGLGLDSVDALQLVVQIEKTYQILIENEEVGMKALASIAALADFITAKQS